MRALGAYSNGSHQNAVDDMAGAQDTIYLCNFRVSVDGEWLCLKELQDLDMQEVVSPLSDDALDREREWVQYSRDPAAIERSNLVNICKLVVKELLEQSLRFGRMLDSDHLPLQHFFIVLEHVLRHGLKPKKGLLGPKKELWDLLQSVEKFCPESQDITASIRDLPTVRTHMGRARAWLRLALMQKKLADYLQALIEHRDNALNEYYEPHALMMSDEVIVIMGLLVGLNVIDCNLCVKGEDLDSQQGVIDFSLYLRSSSRCSPEEDIAINDQNSGHMTAVLDQKNYIEELNRHLNATVGNLQAKVEALTTTNALMKEDLAIAKTSLASLQAENKQLRNFVDVNKIETKPIIISGNADNDQLSSDISVTLMEERRNKLEIEKELELQMCLKAETEMAMKLLEKDIHEKQDTIVSLRRQLEDIKLINLEMYKKLQECDSSLKHKSELVYKLEAQSESMNDAIQQLHGNSAVSDTETDNYEYSAETACLQALQESSSVLTMKVLNSEARVAKAECDLRIEQEWRISLQSNSEKDREKISNLQADLKQVQDTAKKNIQLEQELLQLREQYRESQNTLEEVGIQLSLTKLKISDLQENAMEASINSSTSMQESTWASDKNASNCKGCNREFHLARRKHHCRNCGEIFCHTCSERVVALDSGSKPVRVCDSCYNKAVNSC